MRTVFLVTSIAAFCYIIVNVLLGGSLTPILFETKSFNDAAFSATANAELTEAEALRDNLIGNYKWWRDSQSWAGFIALGCSAVATLIAGWTRAVTGSDGEDYINKKVTTIGLATAIATIANMAYDQAADRASITKESAVTVTEAISDTAAELRALPQEEARIISDLRALLQLQR